MQLLCFQRENSIFTSPLSTVGLSAAFCAFSITCSNCVKSRIFLSTDTMFFTQCVCVDSSVPSQKKQELLHRLLPFQSFSRALIVSPNKSGIRSLILEWKCVAIGCEMLNVNKYIIWLQIYYKTCAFWGREKVALSQQALWQASCILSL